MALSVIMEQADKVKGIAYPLYQMGLAAQGEWNALSFLAGLDVVLAALSILLLKWLCEKGSNIFETLSNA